MRKKQIIRLLIADSIGDLSRFLRDSFNTVDIAEITGVCDIMAIEQSVEKYKPDAVIADYDSVAETGVERFKENVVKLQTPLVIVCNTDIKDIYDDRSLDDYIIRMPKSRTEQCTRAFVTELMVKIANAVNFYSISSRPVSIAPKQIVQPIKNTGSIDSNIIVALGASTGGTDALETVIQSFPKDFCPVVVVQHMPKGFTKMYADRLDKSCSMTVREASDGDRLERGLCLIGAGEFHLTVHKDNNGYFVKCKTGEKVSGHCPSVDVLFKSVAKNAENGMVSALLTGMGADGAKGLLDIKNAGGYTIGQDEKTCIVYGMPMEAYKLGACCEQVPLENIGATIVKKVMEMSDGQNK